MKFAYYIGTILTSVLFFQSCISLQPKDFTYLYKNENTGLDTLISTDGYYTIQRECDSTFHSAFIFHNNGLFTIATATDLSPIEKCWTNKDTKSTVCQYPSWGTYILINDTIKTQTIRQEGIGYSTIFRDYLILSNRAIVNISEYVIAANTITGYMVHYPSFYENNCQTEAQFFKLKDLPDISQCPYLNKSWFAVGKKK